MELFLLTVFSQHLKEEVFYQTERENRLQVDYANLMSTRNSVLQLIKEYELSKENGTDNSSDA